MILEVCVLPILKKKAAPKCSSMSPIIIHKTFFGAVRLPEQGARYQLKRMRMMDRDVWETTPAHWDLRHFVRPSTRH